MDIRFLQPANEVMRSYVFTGVCHSIQGGGVPLVPCLFQGVDEYLWCQIPSRGGHVQGVLTPGPLGGGGCLGVVMSRWGGTHHTYTWDLKRGWVLTPSPSMGYGRQSGGTHPTGMLSFNTLYVYSFSLNQYQTPIMHQILDNLAKLQVGAFWGLASSTMNPGSATGLTLYQCQSSCPTFVHDLLLFHLKYLSSHYTYSRTFVSICDE